MQNKSKNDAPAIKLDTAALTDETIKEMAKLFNARQWDRLVILARTATKNHPGQILGWKALGEALLKLGRWAQAADALSEVVKLWPGDAEAHNDLGFVFYNLGREEEAEANYRHALELNPRLAKAHDNLGALLIDLGRFSEAAVNLQQSLEINPNSYLIHYYTGILMYRIGGKDDEAITCLERSIELNPSWSDSYTTLGNILLRKGQADKSMAMFMRAREICPLMTWHARKEDPDFSVVLLYAPGNGCTPVNHLVRKAFYDCHFYCVLPGFPQNLDVLRTKANVVINLIADADSGKDILPFAQDLVERLDRPTVNHPSLIMNTNRETVARRLDGIPLCRIPRTRRLAGSVLAAAAENNVLDGFSMPLLARLAGNHGGDDFEKFDDIHAVAEFVSKRPEADFYVIEYVDYRSADGFFRKYRLISIDGELLPYHLAIHDDWKVHHFRTDMANQAWMRREEEAFLKTPHMVFDEPHQEALRAVAAATGLDYCGIDCALDCNGDIVVFEANAAMLVHDEKNELFAYKNPYIVRIKDAFDAMLVRMASAG